MEYKLLVLGNSEEVGEFNELINKLLAEGWELYGFPIAAGAGAGVAGPAPQVVRGHVEIAQALTRRK